MKQATHRFEISTRGKGLYEFTGQVERWVSSQALGAGLLTLFIQHTSASLTIQENADPDVIHDLNAYFGRLVPDDTSGFRHTIEGPDDMTAHIRTVLSGVQLSIPIHQGRLALGTWQGIYVFEHRSQAHRRSVVAHLSGE
jgi:secondary thiamine-phosphate synthase enzyme